MGRASREPSRLGAIHHSQLQQPSATGPNASGPGGTRRSASSTRRSGPHKSLPEGATLVIPPSDPSQSPLPSAQPNSAAPASRKSGSLVAAHALSPFTNKTRCFNSSTRSRSDRMSPSAAACLLPTPSIKAIARAKTALPMTGSVGAALAGAGGLSASTSMGDLQAGASEPSESGTLDPHAPVGTLRRGSAVQSSTGYVAGLSPTAGGVPGDGKLAAPIVRRSRLYTENGGAGGGSMGAGCGANTGTGAVSGPAPVVAANPTSSPPNHRGAVVDVVAAAAPVADAAALRQAFGRSKTLATGPGTSEARRVPYRRPSILFGRDGDVTVTGLPPSCLTAGRTPRCKRDYSGTMVSASNAIGVDPSGTMLGGPGAGLQGLYCRRSVDGVGLGSYLNLSSLRGDRPPPDIVPAVFLAYRSHDNGSRGGPANESGDRVDLGSELARIAPSPLILRSGQAGACDGRQQQQLQHQVTAGGGEGSLHSTALFSGERNVVVGSGAGGSGQHAAAAGELQDDEQQRTSHPAGYPGRGHHRSAAAAFATANSSNDSHTHSHRCEWAANSSTLTQSRFSNSSRLTRGITCGGAAMFATPMGSMVSNGMLEKLPQQMQHPTVGTSPSVGGGSVGGGGAGVGAAAVTTGDGLAGGATGGGALLGASRGGIDEEGSSIGPWYAGAGGCGSTVLHVGEEGSSAPRVPGARTVAGASALGSGGGGLTAASGCEPQDVTSALTRLQAACLAAVAQGDMRSNRLCKRYSTDLPRPQLQSMQLYRLDFPGGEAEAADPLGRSLGPRFMGAIGDAGMAGVQIGSGPGPIQSADKSGWAVFPGGACAGGAGAKASALLQPPTARSAAAMPAVADAAGLENVTLRFAETTSAVAQGCGSTLGAEAAGAGATDDAAGQQPGTGEEGDDISVGTVVVDGRPSTAAGRIGSVAATGMAFGPGGSASGGAGGAAGGGAMAVQPEEEYHTRLMNVLLRGDFLHDSYDGTAPGSDEEDDGVVEYRYGGFELGGGDGNFSFSRQASFMEAVRKCNASRLAR